jgi:hypothetical protein
MKTPQHHRTRIRLTVDLEPAVYETFNGLAQASGLGLGRTIGDWCRDTQEAAQHVLGLVLDARSQPALAAQRLHSYALGLSTTTEALLHKMRAPGASSAGAAAGAASAAPGAGPAGSSPRSVIRGETSPKRGKR